MIHTVSHHSDFSQQMLHSDCFVYTSELYSKLGVDFFFLFVCLVHLCIYVKVRTLSIFSSKVSVGELLIYFF